MTEYEKRCAEYQHSVTKADNALYACWAILIVGTLSLCAWVSVFCFFMWLLP